MTVRNAVRSLAPHYGSTLDRVVQLPSLSLCTSLLPQTANNHDGVNCDLLPVPGVVNLAKFAGRLASSLRNSQEKDTPVLMKATGTGAVNVAVKTMHVARRYLSESPGIGLCFRVNHEAGADKDRISKLNFAIYPTSQCIYNKDWSGTESMEEMWARSHNRGRVLGGRIACALYNAKQATMIAIGPRSVGNVIVGLTWARRILHGRKLDVIAIPHMRSVPLKNQYREMTAVQFILIRMPYCKLSYLDPDEPFDDKQELPLIEHPL